MRSMLHVILLKRDTIQEVGDPESPSCGERYHKSWGVSGHGFVFIEGHTRWQMSVSTRSCRPPSSISWWLESGRGLGAEIDTFSCHIESGLKKKNNCQGTRVFPIILYMSVENTIPWENFDSHLMKSKGTWGGCIIVTHKDLEELWRLRLLPTPAWAEWCLVFRLSSCTMLGNVVWPYILKTTLCMVLGLGPCLLPFALTSGRPSCAKSCLMKNLGSCSLKVLLADPL